MDDVLTYYEALRLLGCGGRLVQLLDEAAGPEPEARAATGPAMDAGKGAAWRFPALTADVINAAEEAKRMVPEWRAGLTRFDRTQRLAALHAVVVVGSFFAACAEAGWPALAGDIPEGGIAGTADLLVRQRPPLPDPHVPFAGHLDRLRAYYHLLAAELMVPFRSVRDAGSEIAAVAARSLRLYEDQYRLLAAHAREFALWAGDGGARPVGTGLSGMSELLADMEIRRPGQRSRGELAMSYLAALAEPVIGAGQAPDGVVLPALGEAYVDPACRVAEVALGDQPSEAQWWANRHQVSDIGAFLAGYLTAPRATRTPLVVLGEPGSGKSKLVEVLAARLPEQDFLPVLVPLRDVAAESMVAEQLEQAILQGPGRRLGWHDLLETAPGALPVVLLDGLDELIQATAVNRYDYLEQVRDFQLRQARAGRPVAVVVTSRTVVADLVRFPRGSLAVQLQPFTDDQVRRWLTVWDRHNASILAARGLRPLPAPVALAHRELTEQPLLLLLVAIFDAADNSLQRLAGQLGRAELYERLLAEFAGREVAKTARNRALPAGRQRRLAAREVQRLAVVALAMFARGQQAASEAELNQDLPVLFAEEEEPDGDREMALTPAQRATGRFFFIHKSEARLHDERVRSYEFLHATFGEFLVARLAVSALREIAAYREVLRRGTIGAGQVDDGFLQAALSFSILPSRRPIIGFMRELLLQMPDDEQAQCRETLNELVAGSLFPRPARSFQRYEPVRYPVTRRLACYSANLVVLLVQLAGPVRAAEFCGPVDTAEKWAQYGYLWRSALTAAEWRSLLDTVRARVSRDTGTGAAVGNVDIMLSREDGSTVSPMDSIVVTDMSGELTKFDVYVSVREDVSYDVAIPFSSIAGRAFRDAAFVPDWHTAMLLLQTVPYLRVTGGEVRYQVPDGALSLPGHLLAELDYARGTGSGDRGALYAAYAGDVAVTPVLKAQFLDRLRQDAPDLPVISVARILQPLAAAPFSDTYLTIVNSLWARADSAEETAAVLRLAAEGANSAPPGALAMLHPDLRAPHPQRN
jgi:hypothetical protein